MRITFIYILIINIIHNGEPARSSKEICSIPCDEEKLIQFLAKIEVLSPEGIFGLAIYELEILCSKLEENMEIMEASFKDCIKKNPRGLYVSLIKGVKELNNKVCCTDNNPWYKKFLAVHPCLFELRQDFESCNGPADWNEEPDDKKICKIYKDIVDCYYIKTAKVCGKMAAVTLTNLIEAVIDNSLGHSCRGINKLPVVKDPMPDKYIIRRGTAKVIDYSVFLVILGLVGNTLWYGLFT